jgi:shikimate dehydrogenase
MNPTVNLTGKTRLVGVIGWPIEHSLSPPMQNAAIARLGLDWVYVAMPVHPDRLAAAVAGARALGFVGINVTIPHKEAVIACLDRVDPAARAIGAVNTVHFTESEVVGYNSDAYGYTRTIEQEAGFDFAGKTVLQLGAGGAGRAMAAGAAEAGAACLRLFDIDGPRADRLADDLLRHYPALRIERPDKLDAVAAEGAQLIANATPLGMKPADPLPIPESCFAAGHVVFDAVYNPAETRLIKAARGRGARTVGGLGMLARQGAWSLRLWTRPHTAAEPDETLMLDVLRGHLGV